LDMNKMEIKSENLSTFLKKNVCFFGQFRKKH